MKKYFVSIFLLTYSAVLVQILVYKNIPAIRYGGMIFNLGGTESGRPANLIPFKSILLYAQGGGLISGINLIGNVVLLVPIGFFMPMLFSKMNWGAALMLAVSSGLAIELTQVILQVGIFDIDDMILNGLGVIIGYWLHMKIIKIPTT